MKGLPYSNGRGNAAAAPTPRRVRYDVKALALNVTSVTTADGVGTVVVGDFPDGNILFLGGIAYLKFTTSDADITSLIWEGDYSVGTTATADATLDGTDVNLIASSAVGPAVAKVSPLTRGAGSTAALFDNTDGSLEINLNVKVDAAHIGDSATGSFTVDGYVELVYIVLGDD